MEALILSFFDKKYGPKIFLKAPESLDMEELDKIPTLMDLPLKGVFIHIFGEIKTANFYFQIPSGHGRGGSESLLISIITDMNSNLKFMLAEEILQNFSSNLINLKDAFKAFYVKENDTEDYSLKLKEVEGLFFSYYNSLKPALKALEQAENRYQVLFKAARDAIFIINQDEGIILDINEEAEKLIEKSRDDILGSPLFKLKLFDQILSDPKMTSQLNQNSNIPAFIEIKMPNGSIKFMELNISEIKLGTQNLIQYIFHDITEIRNHGKSMEILNIIITMANKAQDLLNLLKNVLNSLINFMLFDSCCIYLVDNLTKTANIESSEGFSQDFINKKKTLKINDNPYHLVFQNGVAIFNDIFPEIIKKFIEGTEFTSGGVIPLFSKLEITGALVIGLRNKKLFTNEEKELLIAIGLEIGTVIDKMKNEESLRQSEYRNTIILNHIPLSIFRISKEGNILDSKLDKRLEQILEDPTFQERILNKNLIEILPDEIAITGLNSIKNVLEENKSRLMKFLYPIKDTAINLQALILPIEHKEVLVLLQIIRKL